jgi:hypothetical protein
VTLHCPTADESVAVMRGLSCKGNGARKLALLARCGEAPFLTPVAGSSTHRTDRVETRPIRLRVRAAIHPEVSGLLSPPHQLSDAPESDLEPNGEASVRARRGHEWPVLLRSQRGASDSSTVSPRRFVGNEQTFRGHE